MRRALFAALAALALGLAGCSSSAGDDASLADGEDQEAAGATKLLTSKLYADPDATPSAGCDQHTSLTVLKTRGGKLVLELENRVTGGCEIFVTPDKRSYTVTESESCGSKILKGTRPNADSVELQDNRTRMCEDLRPAILELREKRGGQETSLYGSPIAANGPPPSGNATQVLDVKLYDEPHATVSPGCDKHTHLALKKQGNALSARLEYKLSATSGCEIFIAPNEKLFAGLTTSDDCGSKVYSSSGGGDRIVIKDHSTRLCENVIPARIEVEMTVGGQTQHLYSTP